MSILRKFFLFAAIVFIIIPAHAESTDTTSNIQVLKLIKSINSAAQKMSNDSAISFYEEIISNAEHSKNSEELIITMLAKLGALYRLNANFSKSLETDLEALRLSEKIDKPQFLGNAYNNLGIDYYRTDDYETAYKYFMLSIEFNSKAKDTLSVANSTYKLAMVLDDMGKNTEAGFYYNKSLQMFSNAGNCPGEADVYNGLASLSYKKKQIDSTEYYAKKALAKYLECGTDETTAFMYMNLASLMNMQKDHIQALEYLIKGLSIAQKIGALSQLRQGYKNMSETYSYMGDYKNAYENALIYHKYKDSIFNIDKEKIFQELKTKYETEKKELLLTQQKAEIDFQNINIEKSNSQRTLLIIIISLIIVILVFIIIRYNEKKRNAVLLNKRNKELADINAAKDKFFSIISHDLSSPVASYTRLTSAMESSFDKIDKDQLKEYISELHKSSKNIHLLLTNLLQWSLKQSGHITANKKNEPLDAILSDTINVLQAIAEERKINIVVQPHDNIQVNIDGKMIETVFRNLISNAIKFSPENSDIEIIVSDNKSSVDIDIIDNGPGLNDDEIHRLFKIGEDINKIGRGQKNKGSGLGLILCKELLELNDSTISVQRNKNNGLTFKVNIPVVKANG